MQFVHKVALFELTSYVIISVHSTTAACTWPDNLDFCNEPYRPLDDGSCEFDPDQLAYISMTPFDQILLPGSDVVITCETEKSSSDVSGGIFMWLCDYKNNTDACLCRSKAAYKPHPIFNPDPYYVAYAEPFNTCSGSGSTCYTNLTYTEKNITVPGDYIYICMVEIGHTKSYPYGFTNVTITIQEAYAPMLIENSGEKKIENVEEILSVKEGDSLNLTCNVDGFPLPQITWWFQSNFSSNSSLGIFLQENFLLQIFNFTEDESGIYTCLASNNQGTIKKIVQTLLEDTIVTSGVTSVPSTNFYENYTENISFTKSIGKPLSSWLSGLIIGIGLIFALIATFLYRYRKNGTLDEEILKNPDVFITHHENNDDRALAVQIKRKLLDAGKTDLNIVMQSDILAGNDLLEKFYILLERSPKVIAIITKDYLKSNVCEALLKGAFYKMLQKGMDHKNSKFIPINLVDEKNVPLYLKNRVGLTYPDKPDEIFWEKLIRASLVVQKP